MKTRKELEKKENVFRVFIKIEINTPTAARIEYALETVRLSHNEHKINRKNDHRNYEYYYSYDYFCLSCDEDNPMRNGRTTYYINALFVIFFQ